MTKMTQMCLRPTSVPFYFLLFTLRCNDDITCKFVSLRSAGRWIFITFGQRQATCIFFIVFYDLLGGIRVNSTLLLSLEIKKRDPDLVPLHRVCLHHQLIFSYY